MVFAQSIWDQLTIDNVSSGLVRLWYALEEFVRNIGPGSLVLFAAAFTTLSGVWTAMAAMLVHDLLSWPGGAGFR